MNLENNGFNMSSKTNTNLLKKELLGELKCIDCDSNSSRFNVEAKKIRNNINKSRI